MIDHRICLTALSRGKDSSAPEIGAVQLVRIP